MQCPVRRVIGCFRLTRSYLPRHGSPRKQVWIYRLWILGNIAPPCSTSATKRLWMSQGKMILGPWGPYDNVLWWCMDQEKIVWLGLCMNREGMMSGSREGDVRMRERWWMNPGIKMKFMIKGTLGEDQRKMMLGSREDDTNMGNVRTRGRWC